MIPIEDQTQRFYWCVSVSGELEVELITLLLKHLALFSGSGVLVSCDQGRHELAEKGFASAVGVVHELEEAQVQRQLLLRDAAVRPEPGAQQRPEALHRVDVHLAEAIAVLVARILAAPVADGLVPVAPSLQPGIDVVLVGVDEGALRDGGLDDRLDRPLLNITTLLTINRTCRCVFSNHTKGIR